MTTPFTHIENPIEFCDAAALIVRIPCGIRSKEKLFGIYYDSLRLPKYFGWNWDALDECLRDLSWLPPTQAVAIVHEDLPFGSGGENRAIYLELLRDVLQYWSTPEKWKFQVIMPASTRDSVNT